MPKFYEFFAGGGMARAGLGADWTCLFANDFDEKKIRAYRRNWVDGAPPFHGDIASLSIDQLPKRADLAWASFPCQDLSLAGNGLGLDGKRSGTFWAFWSLMLRLKDSGRAPKLIALENVCGTITSHGGRDFAAIAEALNQGGYTFGALVIDAKRFVPQSRKRLFFVAVRDSYIPPELTSKSPDSQWHPSRLQAAVAGLTPPTRASCVWWRLPTPPVRNMTFADILEDRPTGTTWHSKAETERLLTMMTPVNLAKVDEAKKSAQRKVGGVYRRTRPTSEGGKQQRAEVRFDDVAGCLRTPVGGSSRQTILIVDKGKLRSRLLSPREASRLMGLDDSYVLPENYNEAYHLIGDGVVVDVVRFLSENLLMPLLSSSPSQSLQKAA